MKRSQAGFSILELAIVLTVISLIVSSTLAVASARISAARVENTLTKTATLMELLNAYVKHFGHLPCPANPRATPTANDFGVGKMDADGNCTADNIIVADNARIGSVPTTTLGLMGSSGVDGWNRRFTYVVDQNLTDKKKYLGDPTANPPIPEVTEGSITVLSAINGGAARTTIAIFLLISHGANGHGAWNAKGGGARERISVDPIQEDDELSDERANINPEPDFNQLLGSLNNDSIFVAKDGSPDFDDMVQYRVKWHMP